MRDYLPTAREVSQMKITTWDINQADHDKVFLARIKTRRAEYAEKAEALRKQAAELCKLEAVNRNHAQAASREWERSKGRRGHPYGHGKHFAEAQALKVQVGALCRRADELEHGIDYGGDESKHSIKHKVPSCELRLSRDLIRYRKMYHEE